MFGFESVVRLCVAVTVVGFRPGVVRNCCSGWTFVSFLSKAGTCC